MTDYPVVSQDLAVALDGVLARPGAVGEGTPAADTTLTAGVTTLVSLPVTAVPYKRLVVAFAMVRINNQSVPVGGGSLELTCVGGAKTNHFVAQLGTTAGNRSCPISGVPALLPANTATTLTLTGTGAGITVVKAWTALRYFTIPCM